MVGQGNAMRRLTRTTGRMKMKPCHDRHLLRDVRKVRTFCLCGVRVTEDVAVVTWRRSIKCLNIVIN